MRTVGHRDPVPAQPPVGPVLVRSLRRAGAATRAAGVGGDRSREQWQAATAPRPTHPDSAIPDRTAAPDSAAAATGADPTEFMPPAMVRWIHSRFRRGLPPPYSKAVVYQRYREWDAHLRRLSPADVAALANPGEPPVQPGLPSFPQVVSALHNTCYDVERAVRQLLASGDPPAEEAAAALRERVEHARRWLARHARALCWVDRHPPEGLVEPDRAAVEAAVAALRSGALPYLETGRAALAALFGVDSSPSLSTLLRAYATDEVGGCAGRLSGQGASVAAGDLGPADGQVDRPNRTANDHVPFGRLLRSPP